VESTPIFAFEPLLHDVVNALAGLNDGSLVICFKEIVQRWRILTRGNDIDQTATLRLSDTYCGARGNKFLCVVEKGEQTILTGSQNMYLMEWDIASHQRTRSLHIGVTLSCLVVTKDKSIVVCGLMNGVIQVYRARDMIRISSFRAHREHGAIECVCELTDGTFLSGSYGMSRWDKKGTRLQEFEGFSEYITDLIELKNDVIVSASGDKTLRMWQVTTEECLWAVRLHNRSIDRLVKLSKYNFIGSSQWENTFQVWNHKGVCIESIETISDITSITRLKDSIVTVHQCSSIEIRKLKLVLSNSCQKMCHPFLSLTITCFWV